MSKVYVLAPRKGLDFTDATKYGEIVEIGTGVHPADLQKVSEAVDDMMFQFIPESDYIMPVGTITSSLIFGMLVQRLTQQAIDDQLEEFPVKMLLFDSIARAYRPRNFTI
jgi:hypothetical protein